jgi:hypothetical protein
MFERSKYKRWRKKKIASLHKYIKEQYASELAGAKTTQEKGEADQIAYSITQHERNTVDYLEQEDLLNKLSKTPLEVPEELWYDPGWGYKRVLQHKGEVWVRHELKRLRNADIEFWAKLVVPTLALIISIIALVKKSH